MFPVAAVAIFHRFSSEKKNIRCHTLYIYYCMTRVESLADTTSMTSRTEYSTQTTKKSTLFSGQYFRNHWNLDIGVLGYIGIVWPKEHSPEVWSVPPVTPCIVSHRQFCGRLLWNLHSGSSLQMCSYVITGQQTTALSAGECRHVFSSFLLSVSGPVHVSQHFQIYYTQSDVLFYLGFCCICFSGFGSHAISWRLPL